MPVRDLLTVTLQSFFVIVTGVTLAMYLYMNYKSMNKQHHVNNPVQTVKFRNLSNLHLLILF